MILTPEDIERFWSKVDRSGGPDACWPWVGVVAHFGHGMFRIAGKMVRAHRLAFFIEHGRWPFPCGLHSCDNPPCCNTSHLREGTRAENVADRVSRNRSAKGEAQGSSKLTEQAVRDIRANYALCRVTQQELADRYRVSNMTISKIINRKKWAHV